MSNQKATVRKTQQFTLTVRATESRLKRVEMYMNATYESMKTTPYPAEFINPDKGDYIALRVRDLEEEE